MWKPVLAEIDEGLVPAFIIEELSDDLVTVFVPSVPTPLAGAVHILSRERVHPVDIPFTQAFPPRRALSAAASITFPCALMVRNPGTRRSGARRARDRGYASAS